MAGRLWHCGSEDRHRPRDDRPGRTADSAVLRWRARWSTCRSGSRTVRQVGLDPHAPFREPVMAGGAVFLVMAAVAGLRIVQRLDGMDVDKIAAVTLGYIVPTEGGHGKVRVDAAPLVAVEAEGLIVALGAVVVRPCLPRSMAAHPVTVVVGRYPFSLVAAVALRKLHFGVFFMWLFLSRRLLDIQGATSAEACK